MMDAIVGFGPDLPQETPGLLVEVIDMIPTTRGYRARPGLQSVGLAALDEEANALFLSTDLSGTRRVYAGTQSALYEASTSWTDRSDTGGYALGSGHRWQFAQWGDSVIAAAKTETLQIATGGDFAAIPGAPKAQWMDVSEGFIMLADTDDTGFGDSPNRWWCSALFDYADWTPALATQCASGLLVDSPGPITGLKTLGSGFVAYKKRAMFVATYVGTPDVWRWTQVPGEIGCLAGSGIVSIGSAHAFIGHDNVYLFDGARPVPIGDPIRTWLFRDMSVDKAYRTIGTYDPIAGNVWWFYVSRDNTSTTPDRALVFNVRTGRFGTARISVEAAAQFFRPGLTYDELGSVYTTFDDLPADVSFDSPIWTAGSPDPAVVDATHSLGTLTGGGVPCSAMSGSYGDDERFSTVRRVRPRFLTAPATADLEYLHDDIYGDDFVAVDSRPLVDGKWDVLWSSRWHRFRLSFTGDVELAGIVVDLVPDGDQ